MTLERVDGPEFTVMVGSTIGHGITPTVQRVQVECHWAIMALGPVSEP